MTHKQHILNRIWGINEILLQSGFRSQDYNRIILPLTLIKRFESISHPSIGSTEVKLGSILDKNFNFKKVEALINTYSETFQEILYGFKFKAYLKRLHETDALKKVLNKFSDLDLTRDNINDQEIGELYLHLIKFYNKNSGFQLSEHYTSPDVSNLIISVILSNFRDNSNISIYDPCIGSGSLIYNCLGKFNSSTQVSIYGQDIDEYSHSVSNSLFLISGIRSHNIKQGSTLTQDWFSDQKFDLMLTNPPFGLSWKSEKDQIKEESKDPKGRFHMGIPRLSDSSLLFVQHLISKMKPNGSKIGVLLNETPLYTGDIGSGESDIRKWIIENDWLECVISLPDRLYYNTGIPTYLWILNNNKNKARKGRVQLLDGSQFYSKKSKPLGHKSKFITEQDSKEITDLYNSFEEGKYSQIFKNEFFGYKKVKIENSYSSELRSEYERIPLTKDIQEYYQKEVKPFRPDSKINIESNQIGYRIDFKETFLHREILKLKKEFPSSEWIKLKYIGSFVDDISDNCLVIKKITSQPSDSINAVEKAEDFKRPDNFGKQNYRIFHIHDSRVDSKTLEGYFKSKYGLKEITSSYKGLQLHNLNKIYFLNLKVPIIDSETKRYYKLNLELLKKIKSEIETIEKEVVYQFNSEDSENIYNRLFNIYESTDQIVKEDEIKDLIQRGENYFIEFKETFHTIVQNNYKTHDSIRISSLKSICGFLNSKGGTLLVGVHDKQYVTGIEKDNYKDNDDYLLTVKNLIKDRIGTSSLSHLFYDIYKIYGKRVLMVECEASPEPVYLDGEHFYVRVNPSTEELKGGDLVNYVSKHFKN